VWERQFINCDVDSATTPQTASKSASGQKPTQITAPGGVRFACESGRNYGKFPGQPAERTIYREKRIFRAKTRGRPCYIDGLGIYTGWIGS
jgi:hypothetical protein